MASLPNKSDALDASSAGPEAREERVIEGIGVAPGIAIGPAHRFHAGTPDVRQSLIPRGDVAAELQQFNEALERSEAELERVAAVAREKLGDDSAAIFEAQKMMLRDASLLEPVRALIHDKLNSAGQAVKAVMSSHRQRLEASEDDYLRERAHDLMDVQDRILRNLRRTKLVTSVEPDTIILAEDLSASDIIRFSGKDVLGFATDHGGRTSHVSIIARALRLPAVVGANEVSRSFNDSDQVIIDGFQGRVIINPDPDTLTFFEERRRSYEKLVQAHAELAELPCETEDGQSVHLSANVEFLQELDLLEAYGAEGIGLLRTEMLFLLRKDVTLSEDYQYETYRKVVEAVAPYPATIRLLDLGGDKMLPLAHREHNPFLGWRGVRVLLDRPELLRPQLRAILRASAHGPVQLLIPMVTHLDEVERVKDMLRDEKEHLRKREVPFADQVPLGIMVEVPAVALQAQAFARHVDFFSIGTNDLAQYVLAIDRGNDRVGGRYDALHPAVLALVQQTIEAGRAVDMPVSLCGELGSDIQATPILIGMGLTALSASPTYLPIIKRMVRASDLEAARQLAHDVLDATDATTVRRRVADWIREETCLEPFLDY